jgi:hypothetical protein
VGDTWASDELGLGLLFVRVALVVDVIVLFVAPPVGVAIPEEGLAVPLDEVVWAIELVVEAETVTDIGGG